MPRILFFGSFQHYSTKVLKALVESPNINVLGVVTTPPALVSTRKRGGPAAGGKTLIKTHTHQWAEKNHLSVFTPTDFTDQETRQITEHVKYPIKYFITAGYGKLIPSNWLKIPTAAPLNIHFSLLPKYRGANPAEWAILMGETKTGVTIIKMSEEFDTGPILAQQSITIHPKDTRETLYEKLYHLGGSLITKMLSQPNQIEKAKPQPAGSFLYAQRLTRPDGSIAWSTIHKAANGQPLTRNDFSNGVFGKALHYLAKEKSVLTNRDYLHLLDRAIRAFAGFPGAWTLVSTKKGKVRMKLLSAHLEKGRFVLDNVQLAGKNPSPFSQMKSLLTYRQSRKQLG